MYNAVMILTIAGRVPSKKNSKRWMKRGRGMYLLPSESYENWHDDAVIQVMQQIRGLELPIMKTDRITISLFPPDRIKADLSNKAESLNDLLVDCGVIADDNWFVVPELILHFGGVDKENPRAVVEIS